MKRISKIREQVTRKSLRSKLLTRAAQALLVISLLPVAPTGSSAERSVLHSNMFVLSESASELFREKQLHNATVLQSFAFDNVNQHVYIVQLMAGGQRLPGESAPVSGATRALNGDLTLTKLDSEGNKLGHMFLKGFGHGVQIGVESVDGNAYLWMETDSVAEGKDGWGTQLTRFSFENGKILTSGSEELEKYRLIEGVDRTTVNIDAANGLLTMRYRKDGAFRFGVYELDKVKKKQYKPIADVPQPAMGTFQGFASYGGYLYLLEGNAFGSNGSVAPAGNTYITSVDLSTGAVHDKQLISAGDSLRFREPEGLAIRLPDMKHPHKAQLCFGFATTVSATNTSKLASIYYLDRLLPVQSQHHDRS